MRDSSWKICCKLFNLHERDIAYVSTQNVVKFMEGSDKWFDNGMVTETTLHTNIMKTTLTYYMFVIELAFAKEIL